MRALRQRRGGVAFVLFVQAVLAIGVLAFFVANTQLPIPFLSDDDFELVAEFDDAGGLSATNRPAVLVAGVPSGRVVDVDYAAGVARVRMRLDEDVSGKVHADATVRVAGRSAINDLIVDITPGTDRRPALRDEAVIGPARTSGPIGSDRVIDVLDADTRAYLAVMIGQLREGLDGSSSDLAQALGALDTFAAAGTRVTEALAARRTLLTRLVDQSDTTFAALADRGVQIRDAIRAGRRVLDVTGAAEPELRAAVRALQPALTELDRALGGVQALARPLAPALADLRPAVRGLPPALRATRAALPDTMRLLGSIEAVARDGRGGAQDLRASLEALGPTSTRLAPALRRLPGGLRALADKGRGIGEFGQNFSGVFSTNDANGPVLRGLGFAEPFNPEDFGLPPATGRALQRARLAAAGAVIGACLRINAAACLLGDRVPGLAGTIRELTGAVWASDRAPAAALAQILRSRGVR